MISIPILLVELMFPERPDELWIGRWGLIGLSALLAADAAFGCFLLTSYRPPTIPYVLAVAVAVALDVLAWRLPRQPFPPKNIHVRLPFWFWLTGFLAALAFFLVFLGLPHTMLPPWVTILIGVGLAALVFWVVMRMSGNGATWAGIHRLALAAGPLGLFILLTPIQEFDVTRADNSAAMILVGLATLIFLLWLWGGLGVGRARLASSQDRARLW